jgi:ERCC4-type nuclease
MFGIALLRSRDAEESARLMVFAARQAAMFAGGALPRFGKRPKSRRALQLHILQGLPDVGPTRAARLIDRFGSVEAAITAAPEALAQVDGLGPALVRKIRWAVGEPTASYEL